MNFLSIMLLMPVIWAGVQTNSRPPSSKPPNLNKETDWSALFPEIPNCERDIQPLTQNGKVFEQTANYEWPGSKNDRGENYLSCGSITLRFEPSARQNALENFKQAQILPFNRAIKIKGFDAYQHSPMCGNDEWQGSTEVYFDNDKVLIVNANRGGLGILEFANNADYPFVTRTMDRLIKIKQK